MGLNSILNTNPYDVDGYEWDESKHSFDKFSHSLSYHFYNTFL